MFWSKRLAQRRRQRRRCHAARACSGLGVPAIWRGRASRKASIGKMRKSLIAVIATADLARREVWLESIGIGRFRRASIQPYT